MSSVNRISLALLFAPLAFGCGPKGFGDKNVGYSILHGDSGIQSGNSFEDITKDLRDLSAKHASMTEVIEYGTSTQGRKLTAIKIWDKSLTVASGKRPAILISEAIHGNEYLNISDRLPREFLETQASGSSFGKFIAKGGVLYVVPIVNPDGYAARQRENARGQDLNRDFTIKAANNAAFTQPETKGIATFIAKEQEALGFTLEATMEYHCCIGGLIHPWAYTETSLPADAKARHVEVGKKVKSLFGYGYGTVRDIVGYDAIGGSDDYYFETYGRRSFSFEGSQGNEAQNLPKHVELWGSIFDLAVASSDANVGGVGGTGGGASPLISGDLFVAVDQEATGDQLSLVAAAAEKFDGMSLCLGTPVQCLDANGSAKKIAAEPFMTLAGRRLFRAVDVVATGGNETELVVVATTGGKVDATALTRAVRLQRK